MVGSDVVDYFASQNFEFLVHEPLTSATSQMLDYNVPGGKLNRGMAVFDVLKAVKGTKVRSSENNAAAFVLL